MKSITSSEHSIDGSARFLVELEAWYRIMISLLIHYYNLWVILTEYTLYTYTSNWDILVSIAMRFALLIRPIEGAVVMCIIALPSIWKTYCLKRNIKHYCNINWPWQCNVKQSHNEWINMYINDNRFANKWA